MSDKLCLADQRKVQLSANKRGAGGGKSFAKMLYYLFFLIIQSH